MVTCHRLNPYTFDEPTPVEAVKTALQTLNIGISTVQRFGNEADNEYLIRADLAAEDKLDAIRHGARLAVVVDEMIRRAGGEVD